MCSVSGETDDTIASQIHLFSAQFWRAKASRVSWRRPDVSALVSTVSSRNAVSGMGATKFAQLRLSMAIASKHSPSAGKMAKKDVYSVLGEFFCAHRNRNQAPKLSIGTETGPSRASLPSIPTKPAAYADRLLRYG